MGEIYGAWLATPTGWRAFTAYADSPPSTTRVSHTYRSGRLAPWQKRKPYRQARQEQDGFFLSIALTLGLILIPWVIYRIVWSLAARKPKTFTHTQVITPDSFEWPLVPGDVWLGYGLAESGHWLRLAPEFREPEWVTSRERAEHQKREDTYTRLLDEQRREAQLRRTRATFFNQE